MVIGVCGYSYTGSGAVLDLLNEFSETEMKYEGEFCVSYYPDGLSDLDFHLNKSFAKYTTSEVALKRYEKLIYLLFSHYGKIDEKKKKEIQRATHDYINGLVQVSWRGYGLADAIVSFGSKPAFLIQSYLERTLRYLYKKIFPTKNVDLYPMHDMTISIMPERFYDNTKEYVNTLLSILGYSDDKICVLNQPFSVNNPESDFEYFNDPYAIVVDRDPRDLYLFCKCFLKNRARQIPSQDVEKFTEYYRSTHMHYNTKSNERVLRIRFEDLIYEYEATVNQIMGFCGITNHIYPRKYFDPNLSIRNTQLMNKFKCDQNEIKYIEERLHDYLFPFENYGLLSAEGEVFDK